MREKNRIDPKNWVWAFLRNFILKPKFEKVKKAKNTLCLIVWQKSKTSLLLNKVLNPK